MCGVRTMRGSMRNILFASFSDPFKSRIFLPIHMHCGIVNLGISTRDADRFKSGKHGLKTTLESLT